MVGIVLNFCKFLVTFLFAAFCNIPKIFRLILFLFVNTFFVYLIYVYDSKNCAKSVHCCICVFGIILCAWNFCFFEPNELRYKPLHLKWFSQIICCIFTVTIEKYNLNIITREFMCVLCSWCWFLYVKEIRSCFDRYLTVFDSVKFKFYPRNPAPRINTEFFLTGISPKRTIFSRISP